MTQSLAYEIGAVFLLAALLIGGSSSRFLPRLRLGAGSLAAAGIAISIFAIFHYGPELWSAFVPPMPAPSSVAAPAAPAKSPAPMKQARAASEPHWKTIVVEGVPAAESEPVAVQPVAVKADPRHDDLASAAVNAASDPCEKSQYDAKAKRWLKSAGCAMHLIPHK